MIGRKVDYWRDWWEHQDERRVVASVPPPPRDGEVPIFQQGGWFDPYSGSHLRSFAAIGDRVPNRVLMGPWSHEEEVETFRATSTSPPALTVIREHELVFYDRFLRDDRQRLGRAAAAGAVRPRRGTSGVARASGRCADRAHAVVPRLRRAGGHARPATGRSAPASPGASRDTYAMTRKIPCRRSAASTRC